MALAPTREQQVARRLGSRRQPGDPAALPPRPLLLEPASVDLSVVVPFYNVGVERLRDHLAGICQTLMASGVSFEMLPVSDGSTDGSLRALEQLVEAVPELPPSALRPIAFADNRGKGEALRAGLAHGRGRYLGFIDGDGDIPAAHLAQFVDLLGRQRPEIIVGSKRHPGSQVHCSPLRRLYSTGYRLLTTILLGLRVRDTQAGIKLVRRDILADVLPRLVEKRFAFDAELLAVAHRLGHRVVVELPVTISERSMSTISPAVVGQMLRDTVAVFWRLRVRRSYDGPITVPVQPAGRPHTWNVPTLM